MHYIQITHVQVLEYICVKSRVCGFLSLKFVLSYLSLKGRFQNVKTISAVKGSRLPITQSHQSNTTVKIQQEKHKEWLPWFLHELKHSSGMSDCEQNFRNKSWCMLIDDERYLQQLDMKYI